MLALQSSVLESELTVNIIANTITSDSTVTYYARQTNQAGDESSCSSSSLSYEYDGTQPVRPSGLSLHDPLTSPSNDPTPEITVAGVEPLATVQLFSDNVCSATASSSEEVLQNASTVNIVANTIVSEGTVTYYARQTDPAGNISECSTENLSYIQDESVPLAINDLTETFNLLNAASYTISGQCDASLNESVTLSIGSLNETTSCQSNHTFSLDIDATSVVAPSFTVQAIYSSETINSNSVINSIVRLNINQPTTPFNSRTASTYPIRGACDHSVSGIHSVVVSIPSTTISDQTSCTSNNTFMVNLDAFDGVGNSDSIIFQVVYGEEMVSSQAIDNDIVPLNFNNLGVLNSSTASTYSVSGSCDTSISGNLPVSVVGTDLSQNTVCVGNKFIISLNLSSLTPASHNQIMIQANYGEFSVTSTPVTNEIVAFDCSNTEATPDEYIKKTASRLHSIHSTYFYRIDPSDLTDEIQEFELCLEPNLKVKAELDHSYTTDDNSLVWVGFVEDIPKSLGHQLANSIIIVKRNNKLTSTLWVNGYAYRIWPLGNDLHQIERLDWPTALGKPHITTDPPIPAINTSDVIPEISVMTVFTSEVSNKLHDIYAFTDLAIAEFNFGYRASDIKAKLKSVHVVAHSYQEGSDGGGMTAFTRMKDPNDGHMDDIHDLRNLHKADVGVLITSKGDGRANGVLPNPEEAFAYIYYQIATAVYTFSHEVAHIFGAQHMARSADDLPLPYSFGHGYAAPDDSWRTIMTYDSFCKGCYRLNIWSTPSKSILGDAAGNSEVANNARVLNMTASAYASVRGDTYADISGEGIVLENNEVVTGISVDMSSETVLYVVEVPSGATNLRITTMGGTGDADMYVKAKAMVIPGFSDCYSAKGGNQEECEFESPEATRYHILLEAYSRFTGLRLSVSYEEPD